MIIFIWIILLIALLIVIFIIWRKMPQLSLVKNETSQSEKQNELKKDIYEQRLKRQISGIFNSIVLFLEPVWEEFVKLLKSIYNYLHKQEEGYRHKLLNQDFKDKVGKEKKVSELFTQATEMMADNNYDKAEQKYIEILKLEPKHSDAYKGLAKLYWLQKDYDHASELYNFLLKSTASSDIYDNLAMMAEERGDLKEAEKNYLAAFDLSENQAEYSYKLAYIYKEQGDLDKALEMIKQSLAKEQSNPKYIDFLIQLSIMSQDKVAATEAYDKLSEVNPDNKKLEEYKDQIKNL